MGIQLRKTINLLPTAGLQESKSFTKPSPAQVTYTKKNHRPDKWYQEYHSITENLLQGEREYPNMHERYGSTYLSTNWWTKATSE